MDTKDLGNLGERIACGYLVKKGFKILGKNWRTHLRQGFGGQVIFGEIDIIARKKFTLLNKIFWILSFGREQNLFNGVKLFSLSPRSIHFVEVKTIMRNDDSFFPEQKVDYRKQQKLRNLAQIWMRKHHKRLPYQIDIIGIVINMQTQKAKLRYFANAVADTHGT